MGMMEYMINVLRIVLMTKEKRCSRIEWEELVAEERGKSFFLLWLLDSKYQYG